MFGKKFKYNGQEISTIQADYIVGLTGIDWINTLSANTKKNIAGSHGVKSSPTYLRGRRFTIEGGIASNSRADSIKGVDYLRDLFRIRPLDQQVVDFTVIDELDRERTTQVYIESPVEFREGDDDEYDGTTRKWRVVLFSDEARFISSDITTVTGGLEGSYGGFDLETELYDSRDATKNIITCTNIGSELAEAKITLTVTNVVDEFIKVVNLTTGRVFVMSVPEPLPAGTKVTIDSNERRITVNGMNRTGWRVPGSVRPSVRAVTDFIVYDIDQGEPVSDFDVEIQFYTVIS